MKDPGRLKRVFSIIMLWVVLIVAIFLIYRQWNTPIDFEPEDFSEVEVTN